MNLSKYLFIPLIIVALCLSACGDKEKKAKEVFELGLNDIKQQQWNDAAEEMLRSLSLQDESTPTLMLVKTYNSLSRIYWEQDFKDKAVDYAKKAVENAEALKDDKLEYSSYSRLGASYYTLGKRDSARLYFKEALAKVITKHDTTSILRCYNNLSAVSLDDKKWEEALTYIQKSVNYKEPKEKGDKFLFHYNRSRCFEGMERYDDCAVEIKAGLENVNPIDYEAIEKLYHRLFYVHTNRGRLAEANVCADSAFYYAQKAFDFKQREEMKDLTEKYRQEKYEAELELERTHWLLLVVNVVFIFAIALIVIMYRNKRHVVGLQQRLETLNLQVVREEQKRENAEEDGEWTSEKEENLEQLYLEQFKVSRDIFRARPICSKIRQLKYHTDKEYLSDEERMPLIDGVLEVFLDQLQKLRTQYPDLTEDECLYAVLIFVGCNNATASMLTKTSEATLRKRRSRFKQKTTEQVFNVLMQGDK